MTHHTGSPGTSQDALYRRTDISPEAFFHGLGRVRRTVRDEIERLIEWLDATIDCDEDGAIDDEPCDGDPDSEPSLGSFDRLSNQVKAWQSRTLAEVDAELDRCDDEPALGSIAVAAGDSQVRWAKGAHDDREGDGCADDREVDELQHGGESEREDHEPSLGWTDDEAARGRYPSLMGLPDLEAGVA